MGVWLYLVVAEGLYLRALKILARRGVRVPRGQIACWHGGIALWVIAFASPIDALGEDLLSAHMAEHLLIADLGAPFLLAGMRNPVLMFLLPRPALVTLARRRRLRRAIHVLRQPLVSLPVYVLVLYGWHFTVPFEAAVRSDWIHAAQHSSFVGAGMLVWWSALEPQRRWMRGGLWKIGHLLAARMVGMFLGMGFVIVREPLYGGVYDRVDRGHGFAALSDQQLAGALMVGLDIFVMMFALTFFFVAAGRAHDREEAAAAAAQAQGRVAAT